MEFSVYKNPCNTCCQISFPLSEYTKIDDWGFSLYQTEEFTALLRPLAGFKGPFRNRRERGRDGRREGIAPWLLGIDAPLCVVGYTASLLIIIQKNSLCHFLCFRRLPYSLFVLCVL